MNNKSQYSNWVEVNLGTIENNVRFFRRNSQAAIMAVVKANAYGHGTTAVAQAALRAGADWLGVARFSEAETLRQAGIEAPVLLLGYTPPDRLEAAINRNVSMTVWSEEQITQAAAIARRMGAVARLHLKVDSGMNRLGVKPEQALDLAQQIVDSPSLQFEGVFSHFACADESNPHPSDIQAARFDQALSRLEAHSLRPPWVHASNSAASLTRPTSHFDLLRIGIAMYGLHPSDECLNPPEVRSALSWKSVLSQVKSIPAGEGVSYGHVYHTQVVERIGTIPVGYADGFRRIEGNQVLVAGKRVPVVGRVCMDQMMVQLDRVPEAQAGDEVVLIGKQGGECLTAEEIARHWGTINYEVVCGIAARVPRVYIRG
ncbi:MAG: alanine racemase [Anaerolineales bacterium]|nr:alanine racemase [Anaerolineales bacterium]